MFSSGKMQLALIATILLAVACPSLGKGLCPPVCLIFCPFGNVLDENGCPTCQCNSPPTPTMPPLPTVHPTIDCRVVLCARPPCPKPLPPPPGQCCPTCPAAPTKPPLPTVRPTVDCSAVLCLRPPCPNPLPPPPGECCATCPAPTKPPLPTVRPTVDCSAVLCLRPPCPNPLPPPPGECCATCPAPTKPPPPTVRPTIDCRLVRCAQPPCPKPLPPLPGQCCPRCLLDCRVVFCPRAPCPNPLPPLPGKCCPRCPDPPQLVCPPLPPDSIGLCVERCSGDDGCPAGQKCCSNGCGHVCKVAVNATVPPVCRRGGRIFKVGQKFPAGDGCNSCTCVRPGVIACTEIACLPPTPRQTESVPSCLGDKVYTTCGSACPATCDNIQSPPICIALCVPGCFCPRGTVQLGNRCVAREACPSVCTLPPKTGPCRAAFRRYFYNSTSEQCERFIYGGCLGNGNNFVTREACVARCTSPPPTCPPDKPTVNCFADPCQVTSCPAHPEARCESDFCGGCNARFFDDEDNEVTDSCKCPVEGQLFTRCGSACPPNCTNPTPICTRQCVARCECPKGEVIDERKNKCVPVNQCPATPPTPTCPPDKPPGNCFADPCQVTSCPAHPEARCESDFCGGCNARFFDDEDNEVTDSCKCPVEGQLFTSCGSACPPNCTNPTPICTTQCVARCQCPRGQVIDEEKNKCVPVSQCPDLCELPAEPGPCRAFFPSYFFNATSGRCERFIYGGCRGNANRFQSLAACRQKCDLCKLRPNSGPCLALIRSYFFNSSSDRCERFNYGGCGGNANRFRSVTACQKACGPPCPIKGQVFQGCRTCPATCNNPNLICTAVCRPGCGCPPGMLIDEKRNRCVNRRNCPNICTLSKDPGPCDAVIPSYFFNSTSKRCERFNYGGCGGNNNRFTSLQSCNRKCNPSARCPPVCSATFCKRNSRALCSVPGPREIPGCTGRCQVTFCPACYFSKQPRPLPGRCSLCGAPVSNLRCLKWWAYCINWADRRKHGLPSASVRTQENFRCYRYPCPLRG